MRVLGASSFEMAYFPFARWSMRWKRHDRLEMQRARLSRVDHRFRYQIVPLPGETNPL
jgi:hypothetical protein